MYVHTCCSKMFSSIACNATALWRWQRTTHTISLLLWMHQEKWVKLMIVWRWEVVGVPKSNLFSSLYMNVNLCIVCLTFNAGVCMGRHSTTSKWWQDTNRDQPAVTWWGVQCVWGWNNVQGTDNWYALHKFSKLALIHSLFLINLLQKAILHLSLLLSNSSWTIG